KNYQVELDGRYQVSHHFNLNVKYQASGTQEQTDGTASSVYAAQKMEVDANDTYKIGKYVATTRISLADQSFNDTYASATGSNLLNLTWVQSMVFKTTSLTAILFYNKEMTSAPLLGDMLTSDVIYQYQLFDKIQLSSGLSYLSNAGYARQAGVKQSVQLLAKKHFDVNASLDLMKNLMAPQFADLYPSCRGELNIKYYLKVN